MSVRAVHESAAETSARLAKFHDSETTAGAEWMPTFLYYGCVQLLEASLADYGEHWRRTQDRKTAIAARWPNGTTAWEALRQLSERWRYDGIPADSGERKKAREWATNFASEIGERWPSN